MTVVDHAAIGERAGSLRASRTPYVHARVVLAERPTSAKPGDEALILADGRIEGFVGGQCAESTVRMLSLTMLAEGADPYLLRVTPNPEPEQSGKRVVHNPCLSGGTLEIFLQAVVPSPVLAVLGDTPIADAFAPVGAALGWVVVNADTADLDGVDAVVVASHGKGEEQALTAAVLAGVPYVGLVASPKRGAAVVDSLPLTADQRAAIKSPAGLDIGARTAAEIAMSVFAEMVTRRPRRHGGASPAIDPQAGTREPRGLLPLATTIAPITAIDPVCHMTVAAVESSIHADHDGARIYFCRSECRDSYLANPEAYPA